jgi:hypothetical protein
MLIIRKNETNNLVVTVSMNKTLPNPYYLFSFQHITSKERVSFIPQSITSNTRYDKFRFIESPNVNLTAATPSVSFQYIGQYYYSIYEQTSSANTNPSLAYNKLESGRAVVIVGDSQTDECLFEPYISPNEDAYSIIYVSEQEQECIDASVTPSPTPTNTSTPTTTTTATPTPTPTITPTPTDPRVCRTYEITITGGTGSLYSYVDCNDGITKTLLIPIFPYPPITQCAKQNSFTYINGAVVVITDIGSC